MLTSSRPSVTSPSVRVGTPARKGAPAQRGASLIEVMVAIVVLSIGMLSMAWQHAVALKYDKMSQFRGIATQLASELADRIRANAAAGASYVVTQWSLNEAAIKRFLDESPLPVYLGVPNRCSLKQLARFAAVCGVENAVKGALSNPVNIMRFMLGFDPGYIVKAFEKHPKLAKIHVYAFGNFAPL